MSDARNFHDLSDEVKKQAKAAATLAYIAGANRAIGRVDTEITGRATHTWEVLFDKVDEAYGECSCGHGIPCPSLDEHTLCAEYVEQVEEFAVKMAQQGHHPTPELVEQGLRMVANDLRL
jgi:hypothetical protein